MKVALIGSAPASIQLAPYADPSWQIWACSPGAYPYARRTDVYYELHRWRPPTAGAIGSGDPWFSVEYIQFLKARPCVYVADPAALNDLPNGRVLPHEPLVAKYGPYFFNSSLAWMTAMAMEAGATTIGYWGVDMAAVEEWVYQRPGLQFFVMLARAKGIEIIVPPESDLLLPPPLYGVGELSHSYAKLNARRAELTNRLQHCEAQDTQMKAEWHFLKGALDDLSYIEHTWSDGREVPALPIPAMVELAQAKALPPPVHEDTAMFSVMATLEPPEPMQKPVPRKRKSMDARARGRT